MCIGIAFVLSRGTAIVIGFVEVGTIVGLEIGVEIEVTRVEMA